MPQAPETVQTEHHCKNHAKQAVRHDFCVSGRREDVDYKTRVELVTVLLAVLLATLNANSKNRK